VLKYRKPKTILSNILEIKTNHGNN